VSDTTRSQILIEAAWRSLFPAQIASVWLSVFPPSFREQHGSRGPEKRRGKRGSGRGGSGQVLAWRNRTKIKNIKGTIVARPRHASSK
jgi:hypothetical protein